jgi:hypothetical protein
MCSTCQFLSDAAERRVIQKRRVFQNDRMLMQSQSFVYTWCTEPGRLVCSGADLYDDLQPPETAAETQTQESRQVGQLAEASQIHHGASCLMKALVYFAGFGLCTDDHLRATARGARGHVHSASVVTYEHYCLVNQGKRRLHAASGA